MATWRDWQKCAVRPKWVATKCKGGTAWSNLVSDGTTSNMNKLGVHVKSLLINLGTLTAYSYAQGNQRQAYLN